MNSKRRTRAVLLSALVVFACLTAIPAPSQAFPIKWLFYPPAVGDPDYPTGGMFSVRFGMVELHAFRLGGQLVLMASSNRGTERDNGKRVSGSR